MKRPIHWYWAALISFVAAYAATLLWELLTLRSAYVGEHYAPLEPAFRAYIYWTTAIAGDVPIVAGYLYAAWFRVPFFVAALLTYAFLRRRKPSEYLHCPKCDYILKGLSEPRCPECGERI
jgi:hypothetical protein